MFHVSCFMFYDLGFKDMVRVRIAPSPTGPLHIGTARTALFNYLFAKKQKGDFILRIEDTNLERSEPKWEKDILENLEWLGLNWNKGPYRQSQRIEGYAKYIKKLLESGQAFLCYHSKEELEKLPYPPFPTIISGINCQTQ